MPSYIEIYNRKCERKFGRLSTDKGYANQNGRLYLKVWSHVERRR